MTFLTLYNFSLWYQISSSSSGTGASRCKSSLERLRILRRETISPLLLGPQLQRNKKKRTLIFRVNNAFPLKIERFSQFFHGKTFWIFPRFCWPQSAQHQHTVTFSLKKSTWQFSVQLQNAILAFLLGKFVKKPFQKCGENLLKRLFTFLLCNNKSA